MNRPKKSTTSLDPSEKQSLGVVLPLKQKRQTGGDRKQLTRTETLDVCDTSPELVNLQGNVSQKKHSKRMCDEISTLRWRVFGITQVNPT